MKPTEILMSEHRVIEQVLNCLEKLLDRCTAENQLDAQSAKPAIEFLHTFVDRCHHGKEEKHLFPMMQARGFAGGCSPVMVMLREHELGRLYVQGMEAAFSPSAAGDSESLKWFVQHGQSYLKLLREHIRKEDTCLFPAANHRLTDADQAELMAAFDKFEAEEIGHAAHEASLQIANTLAARFGVPYAVTA